MNYLLDIWYGNTKYILVIKRFKNNISTRKIILLIFYSYKNLYFLFLLFKIFYFN